MADPTGMSLMDLLALSQIDPMGPPQPQTSYVDPYTGMPVPVDPFATAPQAQPFATPTVPPPWASGASPVTAPPGAGYPGMLGADLAGGPGTVPALPPPITVTDRSLPPEMPMASPPPAAPPPGGATPPPGPDVPSGSLFDRLLKIADRVGKGIDAHPNTLAALAAGIGGAPNWATGFGRAASLLPAAGATDRAQGAYNETVRVLMAKGYSQDQAIAIAGNPAVAQQILVSQFGGRQLQHVTIKDSLGNDIPMTFDPVTGRYRDMAGNLVGGAGAPGAAGVGGLGGPASMPPNIDPRTGRDEAFLASLNPTDRAATVAILNGDVSAAGRNMQRYLPYAARAEPGFNQQTYATRLRTMSDFAPNGVSGKNLTAINTALGHLDRLNSSIDSLGNFTYAPGLNSPYNAMRGQTSADYQGRAATFNADADAVAAEMAKVFRSTGMSEADINRWRQSFSADSSPATLRAAVGEAMHLIDSRLDAIGDSYRRGMSLSGSAVPSMLTPDAQRIHDRLAAGGAPSSTSRQPANLPPVNADSMAAAPDGSVLDLGNGQRVIKHGGAWQRLN